MCTKLTLNSIESLVMVPWKNVNIMAALGLKEVTPVQLYNCLLNLTDAILLKLVLKANKGGRGSYASGPDYHSLSIKGIEPRIEAKYGR